MVSRFRIPGQPGLLSGLVLTFMSVMQLTMSSPEQFLEKSNHTCQFNYLAARVVFRIENTDKAQVVYLPQ